MLSRPRIPCQCRLPARPRPSPPAPICPGAGGRSIRTAETRRRIPDSPDASEAHPGALEVTMIRSRRSPLPAIVLACLPLMRLVHASPEVATISGVVADPTGAPLPRALVTLSGDGIAVTTTQTDDRGRYRFPAIPPNHACSVSVRVAGFRSVSYEGMST